jgi:dTDP-4-dehydrorhamnose reductase
MLGTDVRRLLEARGEGVTALGRTALNVTDPQAVEAAVKGHGVVVNCAAWTAVDDAEEHEAEAFAVNATGPRLLARATAQHGARLIHMSTDYVFDGTTTTPYSESAATSPQSAYGRSKAAGEEAVREELPGAHLIVRTAWLYGANGGCFPKTIARLAAERGSVDVVTDQFGQPTWTADVADLILRLAEAKAPAGTYHATSTGETSWFGFAREVVTAAGLDESVVKPVDSSVFVRRAPRPAYSVLGHDALLELEIPPIANWRERWQAAAQTVLSTPQS